MITDEELEKPEVVLLEGDASWHDGPGWYYYDAEYQDEGSCGAFATREEALAHLTEAGYRLPLPTLAEVQDVLNAAVPITAVMVPL